MAELGCWLRTILLDFVQLAFPHWLLCSLIPHWYLTLPNSFQLRCCPAMLFNASFSTGTGEQPALGKQSSCLARPWALGASKCLLNKWNEGKQNKSISQPIFNISAYHIPLSLHFKTQLWSTKEDLMSGSYMKGTELGVGVWKDMRYGLRIQGLGSSSKGWAVTKK